MSDLMPVPFAWIDIPAGNVTLEEGGYVPSGGQTFSVDAFAIAKYPVTNAQYGEFIAADGYKNRAWWTDAGWAQRDTDNWTQPRYWTYANFLGADHPVVGVSWYEAVAFCHWLSKTDGDSVRLPTEQEWQRAAQGDDGRAYPWGNEWDCTRCNNSVDPCKSKHTTPVTQYADEGKSFFNVTNMAGNTWEWCSTDYQNGKHDINMSSQYRVRRGGSWYRNNSSNFRCDFRDWSPSHYWSHNRGFRLAFSI